MRSISSSKRVRRPRSKYDAFTLIEVLVVVAIIALLVAILLPSLSKVREQAKRTTCATSLHQIAVAFSAYSADHNGDLPYRGWFEYTIAETPHEALGQGGNSYKILTNLGLLRGGLSGGDLVPSFRSWVGKEWDVIYCPNMYQYRDGPTGIKSYYIRPGQTINGMTGTIFSHGGYEYAAPLNSRGKTADSRRSGGSSPNLGESNVYPRDYISAAYWETLQEKQGITPIGYPGVTPRFPKGCQALVGDWIIGMDIKRSHNNGINALYSDGHVKFFQFATLTPEIKDLLEAGGGRRARERLWYYYNTNQ